MMKAGPLVQARNFAVMTGVNAGIAGGRGHSGRGAGVCWLAVPWAALGCAGAAAVWVGGWVVKGWLLW